MLYQWELGKHTPQHVLSTFLRRQRLAPEEEEYARTLFEGAIREIDSLDRRLREQAEHWRLERMAAVDRNILRVALFELLHQPDVPPAVAINEALEIARRFSSRDSVEFVNGILDGLHKKLQGTDLCGL